MRWVRSNVRWGAACALLALAIQFALSFGHVHVAAVANSHHSGLAQLSLDTPDGAGGLKQKPKPQRPGGDNACDICILIQLTGSSAPAEAPALVLPAAFGPAWHAIRTDRALTPSRLALFQARGPPLA